jgi:hypothetical protein
MINAQNCIVMEFFVYKGLGAILSKITAIFQVYLTDKNVLTINLWTVQKSLFDLQD